MKKVFAAAAAASMVATPVLAAPAAPVAGNVAQSLSLSNAPSLRSATASSKKSKLQGSGIIVAVLAAAAVVGGIIIIADNDDKADSK